MPRPEADRGTTGSAKRMHRIGKQVSLSQDNLSQTIPPDARTETEFLALITELFDADWYLTQYPDIAAAKLDPLQHFIRYGAAEKRNPNRFFDSDWYIEHNPDVAASGMNPLTHYLQAGAAELRNPHPGFDAAYYAEQHPDAAANPLLHHIRIGLASGYLTEAPFDIHDYLPSNDAPACPPEGVQVNVIIIVRDGLEATRRCIAAVMADKIHPAARVIAVIDDQSPDPKRAVWLGNLASQRKISLIRNHRAPNFAAAAELGILATETHDVVLLDTATHVPQTWLHRLAAQAYAASDIATVSALSSAVLPAFAELPTRIDEICQTTNINRYVEVVTPNHNCIYIRRSALNTTPFTKKSHSGTDFFQRTTALGLQHRLACNLFVQTNKKPRPTDVQSTCAQPTEVQSLAPLLFALTAAWLQQSDLPVILMVTHNFGGGVRRHIDSLVQRCRHAARFVLLEGTDRGVALSLPSLPDHPRLELPSGRFDELITLLRSMNIARIHIHHLLRMDIDIRTLIHRLDVPFDVTVHDYFAICPQINLLRWSEGIYCGEPAPAVCNACIADQSSHGARDITAWRRGFVWQFQDADRVICPSADVKVRLDRYGLGQRAIVVPHEPQTAPVWITRLPKRPTSPIRIALLGVLANHKGARTVAEVAAAANPGTIEIHLAGHLESSFPSHAIPLIKTTGPYQDADLPKILQRIDPHVFWFPSSAPETYSYTLSTAIATGLPIAATDLGAFTERLAGRPLTWLVDHRASAQDWLNVFNAIQQTLRNRLEQPPAPRPVTSDYYLDHYVRPKLTKQVKTLSGPNVRQPKTVTKTAPRKPKIAIVPERYATGGLTPCAYIRLLQPLDHPSVSTAFDVALANAETIFDCNADIIVTQRHAIPNLATVNRLADHARRTGARLLFDLDDDLLNVPATHPDVQELRPFARIIRRMLTVADAVWVSTQGLARRLAPIRPDATVIENRLDERIWTAAPAPQAFQDNPVRILCMGTSTHEKDFALIEPALLRLKAEYGDRIAIDVLGMSSRSELPPGLNRIGPPTHASRSYPGFVDWLTSMQPRWHIGLAPLLDTRFNSSKSPIKAMDYAAIGLAVLASDTPVYQGSLADGPAGQLVKNEPGAWHAALDWLIRNQNLRQAMANRARDAFLAQATLATDPETRRTSLADLLATRHANVAR